MNPALNPNRMRIGIIGGGRRCLAIMELLGSDSLKRFQGEIVGVAERSSSMSATAPSGGCLNILLVLPFFRERLKFLRRPTDETPGRGASACGSSPESNLCRAYLQQFRSAGKAALAAF